MVANRFLPALLGAVALVTAPGIQAATFPVSGPGVLKSTNTAGSSSIQATGSDATTPQAVPKAYIVELKTDANSLNGRSDSTGDAHARFYKRAEEENVQYQIRHEFTDASLFHGLSLELTTDDDKAVLERLPEVNRVWPVVTVSRPVPVGLVEPADFSGTVGSPGAGYSTDIIRDKDYKIVDNLKATGVDRLHALGVKGKGVKIAIIDTGVDYNHPALGSGFGPGKKVAFGRNYVTDDGQGGPDDPISTCNSGGHGSHVAGIIAGEDPDDFGFGLVGVAPEATLGMYRIFSCSGDATNDVVMQAMVDAYNDGADIVSMSLGADSGFEAADPFGQIVTNAKSRGITTIVAAGNSGNMGPMLTSSPAIARDAIAIASFDGTQYATTYTLQGSAGSNSTSNSNSTGLRYASLWPLDGEFSIYAPADYDDTSACDYATIRQAAQTLGANVSSTLFMVKKGYVCDLSLPITNINALGFKGAVIWRDEVLRNPADNDFRGSSPGNFLSISMDHVDGPKLYSAAVAAGSSSYVAKFSDRRFSAVDNPSAGFTSNYSTIGNTWEFSVFKPTISAPGQLILSSWPLSVGGYAIISGTSMATPFVAGCYGLLKSAFPQLSVDEMTNLFTSTAQPAKWWGDDSITHSVAHQGAGNINAWNAYNSNKATKFDSGLVNAGQGSAPSTRNITFANTAAESKTFEISHAPAGLMQRTPYADIDVVGWLIFGFPSKPIYASVKFETATTITLAPGESTTISFVVTPPPGLDPDTVPIYSGYIRVASGDQVFSVPYQGLTYAVNEVPVLERDPTKGNPVLPLMGYLNIDSGTTDHTTDDIVSYNTSDSEYVTMTYFARQAYYVYRVDLVAANTTFEPTYHGFNTSNHIETTTPSLPVVDTFQGVESFATVFREYYMQPTYHILSWWGGITDADNNDALVPEGDYRLLLRILGVSRDYDDSKAWTSWLGPVVRITGP